MSPGSSEAPECHREGVVSKRLCHHQEKFGAAGRRVFSGWLNCRKSLHVQKPLAGHVAKRFEQSAVPQEEFPNVTTGTGDEAANKVAAGMHHDEADEWESQPATDRLTGCMDVQL